LLKEMIMPRLLVLSLALVITACSHSPDSQVARDGLSGAQEIEADLHTHVAVLASDEFEGRAPGTAGEEKTVAYLQREFAALGTQPGNGESWVQQVPITTVDAQPGPITIAGSASHRELGFTTEINVGTQQQIPEVVVSNSEMVFAGYGIVAPERNWNDYAGIDVEGKTVVVLVNDPGYYSQDSALFNGNTMTYYGRWTYKYEEAARQGAAAVLIVHEIGAAGYPWEVVSGPSARIGLTAEGKHLGSVEVEGWITQSVASELLDSAGMNYESLKKAASAPGFKAVAMGDLRFSVTLTSSLEAATSSNVMALIPGTAYPEEYVIHTAHWDHLGVLAAVDGDDIYNGASDNASGTAALLAMARQYMKGPAPQRSVVLLAVTAEESGLLGSQWYAENPIYPLATTVANLNMDNIYKTVDGRTTEVAVVGFGNSELDGYLAEAALKQDRVAVQEPSPEKGYYYRSDHFNFAKVGVPALYTTRSPASREHGPIWGQNRLDSYTADNYHKPSDEYSPNWDLSGSAENVLLQLNVGRSLANSRDFPNWSADSEFRAKRDESKNQRDN
jgi:Zn-dependent M28 family amino/carboxypeptidase